MDLIDAGNLLQNIFLEELCETRVPVTVFLTNGVHFQGVVRNFDNATLLMEVEGRQQLIYKHVLSTLVPHFPLDPKIYDL